ncbi:MAG: isoprenylcysteine carboxylmethyltransferase family protein [Bacteroidetes bacterium]|nr:MAG: isoprenylcysteine carboxylmethyltransferase family protein [Bacteroidota bacterium]
MNILYFTVVTIWFFSEIALVLFKRSKKSNENKLDKSSLKYLWIVILISISLGIYVGILGFKGTFSTGFVKSHLHILYYCGLASIIIGVFIRWKAIYTLRKFFTVNVTVEKNQKIIQKGLYKYLRHPSYTGSLLSFLGLGLSFSNWLSTIIIFVPIFFVFAYRIKIEEKALINNFGDKYINYSKSTKRLIPFIY